MNFAVINQKGGAGKTTLAVHLACYLLDQGNRVAFVDNAVHHFQYSERTQIIFFCGCVLVLRAIRLRTTASVRLLQ